MKLDVMLSQTRHLFTDFKIIGSLPEAQRM